MGLQHPGIPGINLLKSKMSDLKYSEILKLNKELEFDTSQPLMTVSVLCNTTNSQIKEVLELKCKHLEGNIEVNIGDYDNIVQDSFKFNKSNLVIVFWEAINIIDGLQYEIELMSFEEIDGLVEKTINELTLMLKNLESTSKIIFNKFSASPFTWMSLEKGKLDYFCERLNHFIENSQKVNLSLVDLDKVLLKEGVDNCIDYRFYSSSKSLYTIGFYKTYVKLIEPHLREMLGRVKKVLILDCDNTLWGGVIGEDGVEGIKVDKTSAKGKVYREVQILIKKLAKQGALINLNSKNNYEDVQQVLESPQFMPLSDDDIIIKKVNWNNKVQNINEIIKELNVGLNSTVFIDDSDFEVNLVRENLSEVDIVQVPKKIYNYPFIFRVMSQMFYSTGNTAEDLTRVEMYKTEQKRKEVTTKFDNLDDYINSLEIIAEVSVDPIESIERLAQMTQKTNQFNLTTKRYSKADMTLFVESENFSVFSLSVDDKFGSYGITGLAIIRIDGDKAVIDSLLLSCRILGRKIEIAFFNEIIKFCISKNLKQIDSIFIETKKNIQVKSFYDLMGMKVMNSVGNEKNYTLQLNNYLEKKCSIKDIKVLI